MENIISKVEFDDHIIQVKLQNVTKHPLYIARIFEVISNKGVNIDMISQVMLEEASQIEFTCSIDDQDKLNEAIEVVKQQNPQVEIYQNRKVAKLCVHGKPMEEEVGVAAKVFSILGENDISFYQVTTSSTSISYIIDKEKIENAFTTVKDAFIR